MIVLKNGTLIEPSTGFFGKKDVLIDGEKVVKIAETIDVEAIKSESASEVKVYDCTDKYIGPGLVDVHAHFRDPGFTYKEDIKSGSLAAAKGGFTSVVLMANTKPAVDNEETIRYVLDKGKETGIHVYTCENLPALLSGLVYYYT